jgi:hypothetical protein
MGLTKALAVCVDAIAVREAEAGLRPLVSLIGRLPPPDQGFVLDMQRLPVRRHGIMSHHFTDSVRSLVFPPSALA